MTTPSNHTAAPERIITAVGAGALGLTTALAAFFCESTLGADTSLALFATVLIAVLGVPIAVRDVRMHRIRNRDSLDVAIAVTMLAITAAAVGFDIAVLWAVSMAATVFAIYTTMAAVGWLGFGDVKLATPLTGLVGLLAGPQALALPLFALILTIAHKAVLAAIRHPSRRTPHAPALVASALVLIALSTIRV